MNKQMKMLGIVATALMIPVLSACGNKSKDVAFVIENDYVKVAEYKGRTVTTVETVDVDDEYLADKFSNVVDFYNSYQGTEYSGTDDDTVYAVTGGTYSTYAEWCDAVRDGYADGEAESSEMDMKQLIWNDVFTESELTAYNQEDYEKRYAEIKDALLTSGGYEDVNAYCEGENVTEDEYKEILDTTTLYYLKYYYVLDAIAEAEDLTPTDADMDEIFAEYMEVMDDSEVGSEAYESRLNELKEDYDSYYYEEVLNRVLDCLYENRVD